MTTILHPGAPHPLPRPRRASPGLSSPGLPSHHPDPVASRLAAGAAAALVRARSRKRARSPRSSPAPAWRRPGLTRRRPALSPSCMGWIRADPARRAAAPRPHRGTAHFVGRWRARFGARQRPVHRVRETLEGSGPGDWQAVCTLAGAVRAASSSGASPPMMPGGPGSGQARAVERLSPTHAAMRARAFALRDGFADVLGGLYLREELEGSEPRWSAPGPRGGPKSAPAPGPDLHPLRPRNPKVMRSRAYVSSTLRPVRRTSAGTSAPVCPNRRSEPRRTEPARPRARAHRRQ